MGRGARSCRHPSRTLPKNLKARIVRNTPAARQEFQKTKANSRRRFEQSRQEGEGGEHDQGGPDPPEKADVTQKAAAQVLDAFCEAVREAAARDERTALPGFGTFAVVQTAARRARNPQTGEALEVPARPAVRFRAGKSLREAVRR